MKEMKDNCCYHCQYYKAYYTKGNTNFDRLDYGLCTQKKETVDKHCGCEKFEYRFYGRVNRKQLALEALAENINLFSEIKQILEEDDDEALDEVIFEYKRRKKQGR